MPLPPVKPPSSRVLNNSLMAIDLAAALTRKLDRIRKLAISGLYSHATAADKDAVIMNIMNIVDEKLNK